MKVDGVREKVIYHHKNFACCCQIQVHRYAGLRRVRCMEVFLEHMRSRPESQNRRPRNAMTPDKKPSTTENFSQRVKNATSTMTSSPVTPVTYIFKYGEGLAHRPKM
jgi:hypothetical protein